MSMQYYGQPMAYPAQQYYVPQQQQFMPMQSYYAAPQMGQMAYPQMVAVPQPIVRTREAEPSLRGCGSAMDVACGVCDVACSMGAAVVQACVQACSCLCGYSSRPEWEYRPEYAPLAQRSYDVGGNEYEVMVYRRRKGWCE